MEGDQCHGRTDENHVPFMVRPENGSVVPGVSKVMENTALTADDSKIAEVAIGCNDKAVVTGNVLEDEKAGFHRAYGRSDRIGGTVGVAEFSSPDKVYHRDIVYAKDSPIVCSRLEFVFSKSNKLIAIVDGIITIN